MNTPFLTDQSSSEQVQVPPEVIERLKNVSSGSLTTELFRKGLRQCFLVGLKPMNPKAARFAGEAFTLRMIPAREDVDTYTTLTPYPNPANLQWEAVENIGPGQVLVIDSRNDPRAASAGAMLPTRLKVRGRPPSSPTAPSAMARSWPSWTSPLTPAWSSPRPASRSTTLPT